MPKKTEKGLEKIHFGKVFSEKKSHNAKKTEWGNPLVSPGIVCNAEKIGKKRFDSVPWANRYNLKL